MRNYKECSDTSFNKAMATLAGIRSNSIDIQAVPVDQLFIMYTKMEADSLHLAGAKGSYALGLRISSRKVAEMLKAELLRRGATQQRGLGER